MEILLKVNNIDLTPYIFAKGYKWTRNDIDGEGAGRTLDGVLHRNRISTKARLDITIKPTDTEGMSLVLSAISPEWVEVQYLDPVIGKAVTKTMYSNNIPVVAVLSNNTHTIWESFSFPLIER